MKKRNQEDFPLLTLRKLIDAWEKRWLKGELDAEATGYFQTVDTTQPGDTAVSGKHGPFQMWAIVIEDKDRA